MARNPRFLTVAAGAALAACLLATGASSATSSTQDSLLLEHWNGAAWTRQSGPSVGAIAEGVTALSPANVWAVGSFPSRNRSVPFAAHWDGFSWQQVPAVAPRRNPSNLSSVAAAAVDDVWAVGNSGGAGTKWQRPLIEHWDGSTWAIVPSPHPYDRGAGLTTSWLSGVAALSSQDAWAVGSSTVYYPKGRLCCRKHYRRTLIEHWDGTRWEIVPSPNPSYSDPRGSPRYDNLYAVAAVSAHDVWAVGRYLHWTPHCCHSYQTLVLHWDGHSWTQVQSDSPGGAGRNDALYGVAADGQGDVWAVGGYRTPSLGEQPLAEHWNGTRWEGMAAPISSPASPERALRAVAVLGPGDIWAAGTVVLGDDRIPQTLLAHWDGTSWTRVARPQVAGGAALLGITALPSGDVWSVGVLPQGP